MELYLLVSIIAFLLCYKSTTADGQEKPWRQWTAYRGYMSSGVMDNADLPESFNIEKSINIRWILYISIVLTGQVLPSWLLRKVLSVKTQAELCNTAA